MDLRYLFINVLSLLSLFLSFYFSKKLHQFPRTNILNLVSVI
jgi:hypothetical protein